MDVEEGNSEALIIVTTYYYTLLQQLLLISYFIYVIINCWLILPPCCKTRRKMIVFDRPSISPLPLYFYLAVHYTASSSILIQFHNFLACLGLSLAEYARYSPLLYFLFLLCLIGRCSRRWIPGAGVPRRSLLRCRVPC